MSLLYTALAGCVLLPFLLGCMIWPLLFRDLYFWYRLSQYRRNVRNLLQRVPAFTVLDRFLQQVTKRPEHTFLLFEDEVHSYLDVDRQSNRVAWSLKQHARVRQGDCVALFLGNEPAYVWVWLGLAKLGCTMACLNYNIRTKSLLHCIQASGAHVLIAAPELKKAVEDVLPVLKANNVKVFYLSKKSPMEGVDSLLDKVESASDQPIPVSFRSAVTPQSAALYIYTSGTTGLPKAAIVTQARLLSTATLPIMIGLSSKDIFYIPLPLYHSAGFLIGMRGCIEIGATCVLRRKFSASQFWDDCRKYNVTVIHYIGELLRYLCNSPKKDNDQDHRVKVILGNGLRADVWKEFISRFGKMQIWEFYAATEGNIAFFNYTSQIGAVGRVHFLQKRWSSFELIKYDSEKEEPVRGADGFCIRVPKGEAGLLIAKISEQAPFIGYLGNEAQTEKKKLKDVFQTGDSYFNSGDLLMIDQDNFVYFQDRIGDTFRWKGENVATTEVEDILAMLDFVQEVNVYGVSVPYHEGRIGMASLRLRDGRSFDGERLYKHVADYLPSYARPRFTRVQKTIEVTSTFKQRKVSLVEEGFNPMKIADSLYFLDESTSMYVPMSQEIYNLILKKKIKL